MTKSANAVLLYLDRYLKAYPKRKRALFRLYARTMGGTTELTDGALWKHRSRKVEPGLSTALIYLVFLSQSKELIASDVPGALFTFRRPEWLKP